MRLSELQLKEIINISNGKRIGVIVDVIIDTNGNIQKLVLGLFSVDNRDLEGTKDVLKELGYDYKELKNLLERDGTFRVDKEGNIISLKDEKIERKTILQQKKEELSSLEAEAKTIDEAEALIDKQAEKKGQDIGEE